MFHPITYTSYKSYHKTLFAWSESEFLRKTEGSAIRRIGYQSWQRNIAVALGNAPYDEDIIAALREKALTAESMVLEHINWAVAQQQQKQPLENEGLTQRLIRVIEKGLPRDA